MIISVASGKGGTGKTTVAVNLALAIEKCQLLDCDVEEPNAAIFIKPKKYSSHKVSILIPKIDQSSCILCGTCVNICAFSALAKTDDKIMFFPELCHGCGACTYFCPTEAIKEILHEVGNVEIGKNNQVEFVQGLLKIGQPLSPVVIKAVKQHIKSDSLAIIDAPPGTSCPVISAIKDTDFCILVTEPTPFGLHDFKLSVKVLKKMNIPFGTIINRSNLGNNHTEQFCKKEDIPILLEIPFSKKIAEAYSKGYSIFHVLPEYKSKFQEIFIKIKELI